MGERRESEGRENVMWHVGQRDDLMSGTMGSREQLLYFMHWQVE